jgi:tRNA1(Val) A37 N6-methylase TrmN6
VANVLPVLQAKDMAGNLFLASTHAKVLEVLRMANYLSAKYEVVVANPPYLSDKYFSEIQKTYLPIHNSSYFIKKNFNWV